MATKKATKTRGSTKASATAVQRVVEQRMNASIAEAGRKAGLTTQQLAAQQSAVIDYYLLIDFGFASGQPFQPNSIQFYSNTSGFLCYKLVDNASLVSLVPILNCQTVRVTWNTSTQEAVHIYGKQP
jgi:hypothetical protein